MESTNEQRDIWTWGQAYVETGACSKIKWMVWEDVRHKDEPAGYGKTTGEMAGWGGSEAGCRKTLESGCWGRGGGGEDPESGVGGKRGQE